MTRPSWRKGISIYKHAYSRSPASHKLYVAERSAGFVQARYLGDSMNCVIFMRSMPQCQRF